MLHFFMRTLLCSQTCAASSQDFDRNSFSLRQQKGWRTRKLLCSSNKWTMSCSDMNCCKNRKNWENGMFMLIISEIQKVEELSTVKYDNKRRMFSESKGNKTWNSLKEDRNRIKDVHWVGWRWCRATDKTQTGDNMQVMKMMAKTSCQTKDKNRNRYWN